MESESGEEEEEEGGEDCEDGEEGRECGEREKGEEGGEVGGDGFRDESKGKSENSTCSEEEERALGSPDELVAGEPPGADSGDSASESAVSSACTVATTTSYLHGDRTTVQQLVARGLKKKQQQIHRRVRPKKAATGTRKNGAKNKGKSELKWSIDSEL